MGRWGCLLAVPAAIVAAICFGFLGYQIGKLLMLAIPQPLLPGVIGFVAGVDAAGVVVIYLGRSTGFIASDFKSAGARTAALVLFALLGAKCAHGMGIEALLWITFLNVLVMSPVIFWLIPATNKEFKSADRDALPTSNNDGDLNRF